MTSRKDASLERVLSIRAELLELLEGMDYCLDWKPEPSAWSARQVVYHLLDTPTGGIHEILRGMLSGRLEEFEIWADLDNMTPERQTYDLERVQKDINEFFQAMERALESADEPDFDGKSALAHLRSRGLDEPRTVEMLLQGAFQGHWGDHLEQIRTLRDALGM